MQEDEAELVDGLVISSNDYGKPKKCDLCEIVDLKLFRMVRALIGDSMDKWCLKIEKHLMEHKFTLKEYQILSYLEGNCHNVNYLYNQIQPHPISAIFEFKRVRRDERTFEFVCRLKYQGVDLFNITGDILKMVVRFKTEL